MRTRSLFSALLVLAACSKPDAKVATDTVTAAPMGAGAVASISLADIAGTWTVQTMSAASDSVLLTSEIYITPDGNGSTITFPNRAPLPIRLSTSGDSVINEIGPYESALREGVQVNTHMVYRLSGSELVGGGVARYSVTGPDSALKLRVRGTRKM